MHVVKKLASLHYNRGFSTNIPSADRHKNCCVPLNTGVPEVILCEGLTIHHFMLNL